MIYPDEGCEAGGPVVKSLEDLRPSDTPAYMNDAWIGCLLWAIGEPKIVAQFREETGNRWSPGRSVIERMVDDATSAGHDFIVEFVKWANINIWGPMEEQGGE